ncbi:hypothetical protein LINPERPRIM_LOCUS35547 [Linum perenne]
MPTVKGTALRTCSPIWAILWLLEAILLIVTRTSGCLCLPIVLGSPSPVLFLIKLKVLSTNFLPKKKNLAYSNITRSIV